MYRAGWYYICFWPVGWLLLVVVTQSFRGLLPLSVCLSVGGGLRVGGRKDWGDELWVADSCVICLSRYPLGSIGASGFSESRIPGENLQILDR